MVQAKDLRIGNLVFLNTEEGKRVITVTYHEISYAARHPENRYEPIPLSPEVLEKFGFVKTLSIHKPELDIKYYDYRSGTMVCNADTKWDNIEVEYCAKDIEERTFIGIFKYVHQLQNLYHALTGIELQLTTPL